MEVFYGREQSTIKVPQEYAHGTIRITLGMDNTEEQVDVIAKQIATILS